MHTVIKTKAVHNKPRKPSHTAFHASKKIDTQRATKLISGSVNNGKKELDVCNCTLIDSFCDSCPTNSAKEVPWPRHSLALKTDLLLCHSPRAQIRVDKSAHCNVI